MSEREREREREREGGGAEGESSMDRMLSASGETARVYLSHWIRHAPEPDVRVLGLV